MTRPRDICHDCHQTLYVSHDGMQTWSPIDGILYLQQGRQAQRGVRQFWVGASGELLAEVTYLSYGGTSELWLSADQGLHWRMVTQHGNGSI
jgi:hypothetical protein